MLLTITLTRPPATDLGYLLHKSPGRVHTRALSFGPAHVFYPEATERRCTAALLLDIDPVGLVRGRRPGPSLEQAFGRYAWDVASIDDLRIAPFHLLASEGKVHVDRDHFWHMETLARICTPDNGLLLATPFRVVDVTDGDDIAVGIAWWEELTSRGGEGMVVKPLDFLPGRGQKHPVQPAVKVRGPEYLRIIYGPEYTLPEHIERLRERGVAGKRSLAHREFALGIEALERFVRREPLRRVHECVFGVLALESEPVDPRL